MKLCNEHRIAKGYSSQTLRTATIAEKCDLCDETKGVLKAKWKLTLNALGIATALSLLAFKAQASEFNVDEYLNKTYITVGIGYKFSETKIYYNDDLWHDPYSARIEIGYKGCIWERVTCGISHHSQWMTGFPISHNQNEYQKTELFIDYTFTLGDIF